MKATMYLVLGLNALAATAGMLLLRHGGKGIALTGDLKNLLFNARLWLAGMAVSWLAGLVYAVVLTRIELNFAYPVYLALTYVMVTAGSRFFLHEAFSPMKMLGVGIILLGLIIITADAA
jgi:multidrug transporter EmrE-like cation transporter